jgi:hypothetical protein
MLPSHHFTLAFFLSALFEFHCVQCDLDHHDGLLRAGGKKKKVVSCSTYYILKRSDDISLWKSVGGMKKKNFHSITDLYAELDSKWSEDFFGICGPSCLTHEKEKKKKKKKFQFRNVIIGRQTPDALHSIWELRMVACI